MILAIAIIVLLFGRSEFYKSFPDLKLKYLQNKIAQVIPEAANVQMVGSDQAFTINKKKVYICLKDDKQQYYSDNMLTYVILHELAHVFSKSFDHTLEWEMIFTNLLKRCEQARIYDPKQPIVANYCPADV